LIHADANLDHEDDEGNTALQKAALNNYQDCVDLLLENGANINAKDKKGRTALYFAAEEGHCLLVE
jgi:ankyrin repeat protein